MPHFQLKVPVERYEWFIVEADNEHEALNKAKHGVRETHKPIDEYNEQRWDEDPIVECLRQSHGLAILPHNQHFVL